MRVLAYQPRVHPSSQISGSIRRASAGQIESSPTQLTRTRRGDRVGEGKGKGNGPTRFRIPPEKWQGCAPRANAELVRRRGARQEIEFNA